MVYELISLCEEIIQALEILKEERLISENEFASHLEKKLEFMKKIKVEQF